MRGRPAHQRRMILDAIAQGCDTSAALASEIGLSPHQTANRLSLLCAKGFIEPAGGAGRTSSVRWRIKEKAAPSGAAVVSDDTRRNMT